MNLDQDGDSETRFRAYVSGLGSVIGHADRAGPLRDYCTGLMLQRLAQDNQRSLALFNEMETNPICPDRAMCNAAGGLRIAQARSADSAHSRRAKAANEFTSPHR